MTDFGLLVLRLVFGLGMAYHGFSKVFGGMDQFTGHLQGENFPLPQLFAWVGALAELLGGACVALGLMTRVAALLPAFNMVVALLWVHWGQPFAGGWELPVLYLGGFIAIALLGPGKASLDGIRGRGL
ncbi:MAG: DoxX family protein [Planctomycetota bacterium]|nr:MAG: DoxX family protein [Planctomycetota bacterium]